MKKVDNIIVARAILATGSTVLLLRFFVRESHLTIAIIELCLLLLVIFSVHSWGVIHGQSKVIDFLTETGYQGLAAEYLRQHKSDDCQDSTSLSSEELQKITMVIPDLDIDSDKSTKTKELSGREKLTEEQRRRIPLEAKERTHQELADQYGVTRQYISRLCKEAEETKSPNIRKFWHV